MASDIEVSEPEAIDLPNVLVTGFAVNSAAFTGTEGEALAYTVLSFELALPDGSAARQSFMVPKRLAKLLRNQMKRPVPLSIHNTTNTNNHEEETDGLVQ